MKDLVFSGVQPSASQVHVGNYIGAMKNFVSISKSIDTIVCIVDLHALTTVRDARALAENKLSLAAAYLSIGLDPNRVIIFNQSDVPEVCELMWYLSCVFPLGLLERAHALKDAKAKNKIINSGVMFYPILMAADILLYNATKVPVGPDQKQHIEMTRDIAEKFNNEYGTNFNVPQPLINEQAGVITGLDGRKMSKSYDNYIGLFETSKALKKKINTIVTDSKGVDDVKDPEACNIFSLYKHFATLQEIQELAHDYAKGGFGYGHAKARLFDVMERELQPIRNEYNSWMQKQDDVRDILANGASRAREIAIRTMEEVRSKIGVR